MSRNPLSTGRSGSSGPVNGAPHRPRTMSGVIRRAIVVTLPLAVLLGLDARPLARPQPAASQPVRSRSILTEGEARRGFQLLDETRLLQVIFPEIEAMKGVDQSPDFHPEGDVFVHTLLTLGHLSQISNLESQISESLAYGCLLHDIAKPACVKREGGRITFYGHSEKGAEMAVEILKRLKRSGAVWERVAYLVKHHLRHTQAPKMRLSTLKRFLGEGGIEELLELTRIDALSANGDLRYYHFCKQKMAELKHEEIHPEPLLRGKDLIAMGFSPGPLFHTILKEIEEAQLEGEIQSREQAVERVTRQYKR